MVTILFNIWYLSRTGEKATFVQGSLPVAAVQGGPYHMTSLDLSEAKSLRWADEDRKEG